MYLTNSTNAMANLKDIDPNQLVADAIADGERWADLDAAASTLEETRKSMLSKLTLDFMEGVSFGAKAMPITQSEIRALASTEYDTHLKSMVTARKAANRARVRYDMAKMRLELLRTAHATMRAEMFMARSTT